MALDFTPPEALAVTAYDADQPPPFQPGLFAPFPIPVVTIQAVPEYVPPAVPAEIDIEERISRAEGVLTRLLLQKRPVAVSWSAGKDSSTVLSLMLVAAVKLKLDGHTPPPIVVVHGDTGVENPEMSLYARNEMLQVRAYAKRHGLPVTVSVAHPNLTSQWAVRVIGGRALPTFPGTNRDCSVSLKIEPMKKLRKAVLKDLARSTNSVLAEPCVLIGTRYEESTTRGANMTERGESDVEIRRGIDEKGKPSHLFLSPIAYWSTDDVWMYLAMARSGEIDSYSSFEETFRVYADSMGTSCVIVAEDMYKALKNSRACGARTGCSVCTAVGVDKSMENMLSGDGRYAYMRGLNDLRNFLTNTRWDMSRRSWLGRTIKHGYIKIAADAYSPNMMEELLRYALTIDANEQAAAYRAGVRPRFQLVNMEQLFAIDAMWSLQAFHRPFHALKIWRDVHERGERYPVPHLEPFQRPKTMPTRYLYVGQDWEQGDAYTYTGLRSMLHEMVAMDSEGCMGNTREDIAEFTRDAKEIYGFGTVKSTLLAGISNADIDMAVTLLLRLGLTSKGLKDRLAGLKIDLATDQSWSELHKLCGLNTAGFPDEAFASESSTIEVKMREAFNSAQRPDLSSWLDSTLAGEHGTQVLTSIWHHLDAQRSEMDTHQNEARPEAPCAKNLGITSSG